MEWVEELDAYCIVIFDDKQMKISSGFSSDLPALISAYELDPYKLVITGTILSKPTISFRMDVTRNDIAVQLRRWLDGNVARNPLILIPKSVENIMIKYIKFGSIPPKESLILWILSNSDMSQGLSSKSVHCVFGGMQLSGDDLLGAEMDNDGDLDGMSGSHYGDDSRVNPFTKTVQAATSSLRIKQASLSPREMTRRSGGGRASHTTNNSRSSLSLEIEDELETNGSNSAGHRTHAHSHGKCDTRRPSTSPSSRTVKSSTARIAGTYNSFEAARNMLGTSQALSELKRSRAKGREGTAIVASQVNLADDHFRLGAYIERSRKKTEEDMEERRKVIQIAKARQAQTMQKLKKVREGVDGSHGSRQWLEIANSKQTNIYCSVHSLI